MSVVLIPVALALFAIAAVALAIVRFQQERDRRRKELEERPGVLRYIVPEGQDPAVIIAALRHADLDVSPADGGPANFVLIGPPAGTTALDREHVRSLVAEIRRTSLEANSKARLSDVRFADEPPGTDAPPHVIDPGTPHPDNGD